MHRSVALVATLLSLSAPLVSGANQVHVVLPGVGTSPLQDAVNAAAEGDIVYVPGTASFNELVVVDNKSLTIVQEQPPVFGVGDFNRLRIQNLAAGKRVVVRGFTLFAGVSFVPTAGVTLSNNLGTVVLEDVIVQSPSQGPTILVQNSAAVFLTRCEATGHPGAAIFPAAISAPEEAVRVIGSKVFAYDCAFAGGAGAPATAFNPFIDPPLPGQDGAPAITLTGGELFASGGTLTGGAGGSDGAGGGACIGAGNGAPGILFTTGSNVVRVLGSALAGGSGGAANPGCTAGTAGPATEPATGLVFALSEAARGLELSPYVREGQSATVTATGQAGDLVKLLFAALHSGVYAPGLQGALLPGLPIGIAILGTLPPGGSLELSLPIAPGTLPAGCEGVTIFAQGLVAGQGGLGVLSSPTALTLVQAGF